MLLWVPHFDIYHFPLNVPSMFTDPATGAASISVESYVIGAVRLQKKHILNISFDRILVTQFLKVMNDLYRPLASLGGPWSVFVPKS